MPNADTAVRMCLRLRLAKDVGGARFRSMLDHFGDVEGIFAAAPAGMQTLKSVLAKAVHAVFAVDEEAIDRELESAEALGVRILPYPLSGQAKADGGEYPLALVNMPDPPPVLYVRGHLEPADAIALAVVGARRCTHYGVEQAERFGALLVRAGFTIVSGGAYGIDTAAHRGALKAGGRTIAVMGCGLQRLYPPENRELFDSIVNEGRGEIVSELPMAIEPKASNFPLRNRLISGLSQGVLVIEAARKSGSLITARLAAEQGRAVFALPGRVDNPFSQGTNELIRDGVTLVQDLEDILEQLDGLGQAITKHAPDGLFDEKPPARPVTLDQTERQIVEAFDTEPLTIDQLVPATGLPVHRIVAAMTTLTLKGIVAQQPGNVFVLKRRP
ncbi:MAG: DNA-protecting protein DprA [Planctomycetes bacterium]|nr:DNA-protecting protein DprA [Planctomycetota bacterium]